MRPERLPAGVEGHDLVRPERVQPVGLAGVVAELDLERLPVIQDLDHRPDFPGGQGPSDTEDGCRGLPSRFGGRRLG